eukprot:SAG31_NODE_1101_length_9905_cov_3.367122_11_plen_128_part_00
MGLIEKYGTNRESVTLQTKLGATKVELWPKRAGSGVHAGVIASKLLQRLGITDVGVKIRGSRNKTMQLKATVKALSLIESHEAAAKRRGVRYSRHSLECTMPNSYCTHRPALPGQQCLAAVNIAHDR